MVTTLDPTLTNIYDADFYNGYSGVAKIEVGGFYGTGSLLYDGSALLTAAHLFNGSEKNQNAIVSFTLPNGQIKSISSSKVEIMPTYDQKNSNDDIAIVWLKEHAPKEIQRYDVYRTGDEVGHTFSFSGFGELGVGYKGIDKSINIHKLVGLNKFDTTADILKDYFMDAMEWNPDNNILVADFDSGYKQNDAIGDFLGIHDLGEGYYEAMISPGDSGGPAFIDSKIAGIASYGASLTDGLNHPDIDNRYDSSFGELGFWQRVSAHQEFIDESLRQNYKNQPKTVNDVEKTIVEGDEGEITVNYFYISIVGPKTSHGILSVDYATRDGSARANEDYIPTKGEIKVYPNEDHVLIPVEIIGDNTIEGNETFYMDIFNPVGATFDHNQIILTAQRTIVDDDLIIT